MWEYSGVWACSFAWATTMQESDCLEWELWHRPICLMALASRRANLRHNLGKVWGVLQSIIKWGESPWLLTSFRQGHKSVDERYNAVQAQVNLAKYPPETVKTLYRDIFWFVFPAWWGFVSRTINDGKVDLDKFPASKLWQFAKRMESLKAPAHHIRQVAGDPQAAQINLLRHQCTELPAAKYKKKKSSVKPRQSNYKNHGSENSKVPGQHKKWFDVRNAHQNKERCSKCGDPTHVEGFLCSAKSSSVKLAGSLDTLPAFVTRKSMLLSCPES